MISTKLSNNQINALTNLRTMRAAGSEYSLVPTSYIMAIMEIESNFDPAVKASDFATTGSVGLMQPSVAEVNAIFTKYRSLIMQTKVPLDKTMTSPLSNLAVGLLTFYDLHAPLLAKFKAPLAFCHMAVGYNAGQAAAERLTFTQAEAVRYYIKWHAAQPKYAFLDAVPTV